VLVHRKGATRAFAPHHPMVPEKYRVGSCCCSCYFQLLQRVLQQRSSSHALACQLVDAAACP